MKPLRVVVCGTNFGRFYLRALRMLEPDFALAGIVSRGGGASRALAEQEGVPHYDAIEALPADIDLACVVVGSAISGGAGTELAKALITRGIHVIQEHPVHLDELSACLKLARRNGVQYRINSHYPHVGPVKAFIDAAAMLRARQQPLFVDALTPVHVLYPLVDVLGRALGGIRPWRLADPVDPPEELATLAGAAHPLRSLSGVLAGVPVSLRVQNQLDPADRDNHALLWHRITLATEGGVLTLADTHGPVLWSPRMHARRDADHRLVFDGPSTGLPSTSVLAGTEAGSFGDLFDRGWPAAIGRALQDMREAIASGADPLQAGQYDLTVTRVWADIAQRLGPPEVIRPGAPEVLSVADLASDGATRDAESYSPTAEFFDLAAASHVHEHSAPAVLTALSDVDSREPVVEIGAGTGLLTVAIARARPDLEIIASEPAAGMRAVLTSRVFADPELRPRVTVTAETAQDLVLPERISAAVVCGVAGHLTAPERIRLWRRLAERLAPGGVIVVELMGMATPTAIAETRLATETVGDQRYEWWFRAKPGHDDLVRMHTTWRVHAGDRLVREVDDSYDWRAFGLEVVAEEARTAGLELHPLPATGSTPIGVLVDQPGGSIR
ncbi:Gfo/Idh/MocA family oxidoreductase [Saccharopolyspora sp. ASAGF58]|uniref:Gfo/Idh/MocA family oxidoreductase n=1 Tax=Saccharopolyspora sp. ASAGF58 TaxID=2719023 RepID=UPI001FF0BBEB|nr:Gfo/Idh/MocA family oxidoreductase [Saccharopolyspora sp. ASAGF58]